MSDCGDDLLQYIPAIYQLLADAIAVPDVHTEYVRAIQRVLAAAQAAEQASFPHTLLPLLACQAANGQPAAAIPAAAAWRALHIAAKLLDDVEDGDIALESSSRQIVGQIINVAIGLIAAANLVLTHLPLDIRHAIQHDMQHAVLQTAGGQHADIRQSAATSLDHYTQIMTMKSGACFALAASAGARCAGADQRLVAQLAEVGYNLGTMVQITDDLLGLYQTDRLGDLATGQCGLPVHYAFAVASPEDHGHLQSLLVGARTDSAAESQARDLILALGSEQYLLIELSRYYRRACRILDDVDSAPGATAPLRLWLDMLALAAH